MDTDFVLLMVVLGEFCDILGAGLRWILEADLGFFGIEERRRKWQKGSFVGY